MFNNIYNNAKILFPKLEIKYKNESLFMKVLGKILFFNKDFSNKYITTIGNTIYFPNREFTSQESTFHNSIFIHELIHINDSKKYRFFNFLYLFPQILFLVFLPFVLFSGWWFLFCVLFLAPIPAFFRAKFEKRAYLMQLYYLSKHNAISSDLVDNMIKQFKTSSYYFMWPFSSVDRDFKKFVNKELSLETSLYNMVDYLGDNNV